MSTETSTRGQAGNETSTRVLLLGGTSEIGLAIVRRLAEQGPIRPYLAGIDRALLEQSLAGLQQGAPAGSASDGAVAELDASELDSHERLLGEAFTRFGGFDVVVLAVGLLGSLAGLDEDPAETANVMRVNFLGCGSLLMETLRRLRSQGHGKVIVLSSVAAERPRASNPVYGATKAGLDALAQGLADSIEGSGVRVLVVRPGFAKTRMTAEMKTPPMATTAEAVAAAAVAALDGRAHTVWVPGRLRYVFMVLRHLPRSVFRRLPL